MSVSFTLKRLKSAFMYQEYMSLVMKGCCVCLCKLKLTHVEMSFLKISLTPHADAHFCHRVHAGRRNSSRTVECALFACVCVSVCVCVCVRVWCVRVCVLAGAAEQSWRKNKKTTGRDFFLFTSGSTGRDIKRVLFRRTSPSEPWERAVLVLCDKLGFSCFWLKSSAAFTAFWLWWLLVGLNWFGFFVVWMRLWRWGRKTGGTGLLAVWLFDLIHFVSRVWPQQLPAAILLRWC